MLFGSFSLQQAQRQDSMNDTFWLMTFLESASYIGSQVLANWLIGDNMEKNMASPSNAAILLAMISLTSVTVGLTGPSQTASFKEYRVLFCSYIFGGKTVRIQLFFSRIILPFILLRRTKLGKFQNTVY